MTKRKETQLLYKATRRMVEGGRIYNVGDETNLEDLDHERLVFVLSREFFVPLRGLESLDDELYLEVMEAVD